MEQKDQLALADVKIGQSIAVVDHLRLHGYHGKVDRISPNSEGVVMVTFTVHKVHIQFTWSAEAMGLVDGVISFWKTYRNGLAHQNVHFGHLESRSKTA